MENPKHVHGCLVGFAVLGSIGAAGLSVCLWDIWPIAVWGLWLLAAAGVFAFFTVIYGLTVWPLLLLIGHIFDRPSKPASTTTNVAEPPAAADFWDRRGGLIGLSLAWVLATAPGVLVLLHAIQAVTLRLHLGRWPTFGDGPDGLPFIHLIMYLATFLGMQAPLVWLVLAPIMWRGELVERRTLLWQLLALVVGTALFVSLLNWDPTGYVDWFLD